MVTPVHNLAIQMQILKGIFTFLLTCKVTNMMRFFGLGFSSSLHGQVIEWLN